MAASSGTDGGGPAPSVPAVGRLIRSLARSGSRDEVVRRLIEGVARLRLDTVVFAVEGDGARIIGARVGATPAGARPRRSPVGMLLPVDGLPALRAVVRHRVTHAGLFAPSSLQSAAGMLERSVDGGETRARVPLIAVPVEVGDDVIGVLCVFGEQCDETLVPYVETLGSALGLAWCRFDDPRDSASVRPLPPLLDDPQAALEVREVLNRGSIRVALQPLLLARTRAVVAYEALCRFTPTALLRTADGLFEAATAAGLAEDLDGACVAAAFIEAARVAPALLFVNVTLRTLLAEDSVHSFVAAAALAGAEPSSIVLEFSEREPMRDLPRLRRTAAELSAAGFRIAVDDAGAGHSSMLAVAELRPDFVKLDRDLIHGIHRDHARRALLAALLSFAGHIGARLVAEGVESDEEAEALQQLGVLYIQGEWAGVPVIVDAPVGSISAEVVDAAWFSRQHHASFLVPPAVASPDGPAGPADEVHVAPDERSVPPLLPALVMALKRLLPADLVVVCEAMLEENVFRPLTAAGRYAGEAVRQTFPVQSGITGRVFSTGTPLRIDDASESPLSGQIAGHPVGAESMIVVPLEAGGRRLGTLNCVRYEVAAYDDSHVQAVVAVAEVVAGLMVGRGAVTD